MIPPPPDLRDDQAWKQWWTTTFPVGSHAKMRTGGLFRHESGRSKNWDYDCSWMPSPMECSIYPSGVVTVGTEGPNGTEVYFVVPYGPDAGRWSRWVDWRFEPGRDQIVRMLKPLDDHWAASAPLARKRLPDSQRGRSMKHRRLMPNAIPAPPPDTTSRHFMTWVERTFPPGSNFRFGGLLCQVDFITSDAGPQRRAFNGRLIYGVVSGLRDRFGGLVPHADALVGPGKLHLSFDEVRGGYLTGALRPVADHWAAHQGVAQTMKHRRLMPNMQQPPFDPTYVELLAWANITYAPGTPVKFSGGGASWKIGHVDSHESVLVPDETRGVVSEIRGDDTYKSVEIAVEVMDARGYAYAAAAPPGETQKWMQEDIHDLWEKLDEHTTGRVWKRVNANMLNVLVPLTDNWAPLQQRKRSSYKGKYTAPNKRTSKRRTSRKKGRIRS